MSKFNYKPKTIFQTSECPHDISKATSSAPVRLPAAPALRKRHKFTSPFDSIAPFRVQTNAENMHLRERNDKGCSQSGEKNFSQETSRTMSIELEICGIRRGNVLWDNPIGKREYYKWGNEESEELSRSEKLATLLWHVFRVPLSQLLCYYESRRFSRIASSPPRASPRSLSARRKAQRRVRITWPRVGYCVIICEREAQNGRRKKILYFVQ